MSSPWYALTSLSDREATLISKPEGYKGPEGSSPDQLITLALTFSKQTPSTNYSSLSRIFLDDVPVNTGMVKCAQFLYKKLWKNAKRRVL